jgi:hypothetical protein
MRLTQHRSNNDVLRPPAGATSEECTPAPITRIRYTQDDVYTVSTFWRPSPEDLAVLNAGGFVRLELWGTTMPPANVTAVAEDDPVV